MRFKSRPTEIEAEQYFPGSGTKGVISIDSVNMFYSDNRIPDHPCDVVVTIQGQVVKVSAGEWIISEGDGVHYYPCKDEVFRQKYYPAGPENEV